jgi:S-adenosylmethionine synthetase
MSNNEAVTCEYVRPGHPDKVCDQIADAIIDKALVLAREFNQKDSGNQFDANSLRFGLEITAKEHLVFITGESRIHPKISNELDIENITKQTWAEIGYFDADKLTIINHIKSQSQVLQASSDKMGAGDQGIMVGYACNETESLMPREYVLARKLCQALSDMKDSGLADWMMPDGKCQVTMQPSGDVTNVVVRVQHTPFVNGLTDAVAIQEFIQEEVIENVIKTIIPSTINRARIIVNGTVPFVVGGPAGDTGVLGRKIVVDTYGPRVPVGGGAFSGKDPTKVDRSAAYMARHIAKAAILEHEVGAVKVVLAYAIGQHQPEMIVGLTDTGVDISSWIKSRFMDLSPRSIAERFDLWRKEPNSEWSYRDTAAYGHFGHPKFPWEQPARNH